MNNKINNFHLKILIVSIFFYIIFFNYVYSKTTTQILYKINDEIITNLDIDNEKKFLLFLNPKLNNLTVDQVTQISIESFKNRKIKEIELNNYFDFTLKDAGEKYIDQYILNSNFNNKDELKKNLKQFDISYKFFLNNFLIDNIWREFIYKKFKSKVKIDIELLKKEVQNTTKTTEEINLSEILFTVDSETSLNNIRENIYKQINDSGFEAAASMYSISESKNFGGKLGWIKSSQISKEIYNILNNTDNISEPIKTSNGYLILKVNERRTLKEKTNSEDELKKLINIETEKELNKLGYIYFNKIKKRVFISEK